MYSLDLGSNRAKDLIGEGLLRATRELRLTSTRAYALVRLAATLGFCAIALLVGVVGGEAAWLRALPVLGAFLAVSVGLAALVAVSAAPRLVASAAPFVDVLFTFAAIMVSLPVASSPRAIAGLALGVFLATVVFAALTLGAELIAALTLLAFCCTAAAQQQAGLPPGIIAASGALLGLTAIFTSWGALRLDRLAARLVEQEVARRLAMERGDELEEASARFADINAELEVQHARLVLAQREAETVMGLLVHDMKQPLASIQGLVELVEHELSVGYPGAGRLLEDLRVARGQGERLLAMVADLLAIARLEKGALTAKKQQVELRPLLHRLVEAHAARAPGVLVSVQAEPGLVATLDRELVQRLLENLLGNAISFTRAGDRIELSARREGALCVLAVKNSGPPVPLDARPLLFEKLITRGDRARHNAGLGLYFARLVAEAHQGRIALEPDASFSVAFVVRLPADAAVNTPPEGQRLAKLLRE